MAARTRCGSRSTSWHRPDRIDHYPLRMPKSRSRRRWAVPLAVAALMALGAVLLAGPSPGAVWAARAATPAAPTLAPPSTPAPTATPGPLRVVGLGDSVTSGEHCDCDDYVTGFGKLLAARIGTAVRTVDDGESGSTSPDLAADLSGDRGLRRDVASADVVVVTMGANDLTPALHAFRDGGCDAGCYDPELNQMGHDLGTVVNRISTLSGGHARVLVTNYWNVFGDGDVARRDEAAGYLAWSDQVTRAANAAICATASQRGATCVDLYTPFKGDGSDNATGLLASDGDHPDADGTAAISRAVLAAYTRR